MHYKPIMFHPEVDAIFTDVADGSIAAGGGNPDTVEHIHRREELLKTHFGTSNHTKLQIRYSDSMTYTTVERIVGTESKTIQFDAAFTTDIGATIVLPVADCIATLVYDPVTRMLGVLHLGRHSSVEGLIEHFVIDVADTIGSDPKDWYVWMSPSLKKPHDRMQYFTPTYIDEWSEFIEKESDGSILIDVEGHNTQRFLRAGVQSSHIYHSPENTYTNKDYFSQRASDEQHDTRRSGRMMLAARIAPTS